MVKVQVDLTEKANKNLRIYMARSNIDSKKKAINDYLETMAIMGDENGFE